MRVVVVGVVAVLASVSGIASALSIDGAATVTEPAVRLGVVTTVAPSPGECRANALVDEINDWRVANGQPVAPIGDPAGSCSHSTVMAQAQSTYHSGECYEVVGMSSASPEAIVASWQSSSSHRDILLYGDLALSTGFVQAANGAWYGTARFC